MSLDLPISDDNETASCKDPTGGHWIKEVRYWRYQCANERAYLGGGWFTIGGRDYQFSPSGYMMTGFVKHPSGDWMYVDSDGVPVGGWVLDGVYGGPYWYYLDPATKVMKTGWVADGGSWYYLTGSGAMATGWVRDGGSWYYLKDSGAMHTGWLNLDGTWYYLGPDGAMFTGTHVINGRTYAFDESGVWQR